MTVPGAVAAIALGIVALAMAATDWSKAETVTVVTTEYGFEPNRLTFRAGVPYRLHLENRGKELHEFTAPGVPPERRAPQSRRRERGSHPDPRPAR